ncbi:MAG: CAP domain-containing protein [Vicinamibacterales bacterium]
MADAATKPDTILMKLPPCVHARHAHLILLPCTLALSIMPCSARRRPPVPPEAVAGAVFQQVNGYRRSRGLAPLEIDDAVGDIALDRGGRRASGQRRPGHSGFNERADRIERMFACRAVAENVAVVDPTAGPPAARWLRMWLDSPGHRRLLLGRFDMTGIGVAVDRQGGYHVTQIYVERAPGRQMEDVEGERETADCVRAGSAVSEAEARKARAGVGARAQAPLPGATLQSRRQAGGEGRAGHRR